MVYCSFMLCLSLTICMPCNVCNVRDVCHTRIHKVNVCIMYSMILYVVHMLCIYTSISLRSTGFQNGLRTPESQYGTPLGEGAIVVQNAIKRVFAHLNLKDRTPVRCGGLRYQGYLIRVLLSGDYDSAILGAILGAPIFANPQSSWGHPAEVHWANKFGLGILNRIVDAVCE